MRISEWSSDACSSALPPLDQPPERRADWWRVKHRQKWAEAIIAHRFHIEAFLFPDHPDDLPGTKRRDDDAAMLHRHAMRHAIVERPKGGIEQKNAGARHWPSLAGDRQSTRLNSSH